MLNPTIWWTKSAATSDYFELAQPVLERATNGTPIPYRSFIFIRNKTYIRLNLHSEADDLWRAENHGAGLDSFQRLGLNRVVNKRVQILWFLRRDGFSDGL